MKKEKVIIFEGEHNFVIPKNRVRDKKTGVSYYVPDEMNVTAPVGVGVLDAPIEPPTQPDDPIGSPKTTTTQQEDASKPTTVPTGVTLASKGTLAQNDAISLGDAGGGGTITPPMEVTTPTPLPLGDKPKALSDEEMPKTTTTPTIATTIPTLPIDTAVTSSKMSGAFGGGGGGGSKDGASVPKKTFIQKYWWLLLLVAGGGYYYYKKNKK